jgi:hypothetical protein
MKYRVRFRFSIFALVVTALCPQSIAQNASSDATTFYVANTRPPDAFLALRTNPTTGFGHRRIATTANGTPMKCCRTAANDLKTIPTPDVPVGFKTPSKNIYCQLDEAVLRCDLREMRTRPRRPRDCDLEWGDAFVIEQTGRSGYRLCHGDTVANDELLILSYGSIWAQGSFSCESQRTGLTCMNFMGHGFSLSRNSQEVF